MKIVVKGSTKVTPTAATPSGSLWLTNLDLMASTTYHTRTLYFFRYNGADDFFDPTVLKAALSRALVEFYPMAGRLRRENGRIQIDCNGEGALFVEADCDVQIDDLGDFAPRPDFCLMIPTVDYSLGISTYPITMMQVTRFKCGGVCLGIANQHHAADGLSALQFVNTLSDIARGVGVISVAPFFDRTVLPARNPPQPQFAHIEYHRTPHQLNSSNVSQTTYSVFKLTSDQLNSLKVKCKLGNDDGDIMVTHYSTYAVLAGHVWRCVSKARELPEDQETILYISTDGRSRLRPSLPQGYFGNVIFSATSIALCGELQSNHVKFAVRKIHDAIGRMDNDYLRSAIDYLELQPNVSALARGTNTYKSPNLGIISWLRLPFYDADFGWGKPVHVGIAAPPPEGKCHFLPNPANDGSLLVSISLAKEHMQLFGKLLYDI